MPRPNRHLDDLFRLKVRKNNKTIDKITTDGVSIDLTAGSIRPARTHRPKKPDSDDEIEKLRPRDATEEAAIRITRLFSTHADKPIVLPEPKKKRSLSPPPEFVTQFRGPASAATSNDYNMYLKIQKKDKLRLKIMEVEAQEEEERREYELKVAERKAMEEEKTSKKRMKRMKKKMARKRKPSGQEDLESSSSERDDDSVEMTKQPAQQVATEEPQLDENVTTGGPVAAKKVIKTLAIIEDDEVDF